MASAAGPAPRPVVASAASSIFSAAVPTGLAATLLAVQYQLGETERMAPGVLERLQLSALDRLLRHARATVPYYRDDPGYDVSGQRGALDADAWARLPVLGRAAVQDAGESLRSSDVPADHLPLSEVTTSGSTGRPLTVLSSRLAALFWHAVTLREHLWHGRDAAGRLAVIRPDPRRQVPPEGKVVARWGRPIGTVLPSGPMGLMSLQTDVAVQAEWLVGFNPHYLLSLPSNLMALTQHFRATGARLPVLAEVISIGETLSPNVREACADVWGVPVKDMYSSQELGYIALQCPTAERYHVQSEVAYVEVLDDRDRPCPPGGTGRVVVTALHNYAMPLLRYDIGDYAEVGGTCGCGRGLPVLNRVLGRQRNMLTLPGGQRRWPTFAAAWQGIDVIRQIQLVQREPDHIQARIVGPRPLTGDEESRFVSELRKALEYPFRVSFEYLEGIDRSKNSKFEDFVSLVAPDPPSRPPSPHR